MMGRLGASRRGKAMNGLMKAMTALLAMLGPALAAPAAAQGPEIGRAHV